MSNLSPETFNILFNKKWTTTALAKAISEVGGDALSREYEKLRRCAPRRSERKKCYFVEHDRKLFYRSSQQSIRGTPGNRTLEPQ